MNLDVSTDRHDVDRATPDRHPTDRSDAEQSGAAAPTHAGGPALVMMLRLAGALFVFSFLFGGLPQSDAVRERLARAGLVSSGRPDLAPPPTSTTLPPPVVPAQLVELLASSGYPDVSATEVDRVVTLTGTIPDEASRRVIRRLVEDVPGVSEVVDETVVTSPGAGGDVIITGTTSRVELAGSVPDQTTADAILDAIESVYVADQIDGAMTVDPDRLAPALVGVAIESTRPELGERLGAALEALDPTLVTVDLRFRQLEKPRLEQDLDELLTIEPIRFAVGSAEVDEASQPTLDTIAALLEPFPGAVIEVGGHTDDTGADLANRQLGTERAQAVIAALADRGVTAELRAVGYGKTRPRVVPFDDDDARAANRRIEFIIISP